MNNFGILMKYEWKKLLQKKMVWVSVLAVILFLVFSNLGFLMQTYSIQYTDDMGNVTEKLTQSGYDKMMKDIENARLLEGRVLDEGMLKEAVEYRMGFDYDEWRRYEEIYDIITYVAPNDQEKKEMTEESFYAAWKQKIFSSMEELQLTKGEISYWEGQVEKIEKPFTYHYNFSWKYILCNQCTAIAMLVVMLLAMCLCGMFSEETRQKTDQLVLCTKNGRAVEYYAKVAVGILFGIFATIVLYGISFGIQFFFCGREGFGSMLQQTAVVSPFLISTGGAVFLFFGLTLLSAILESVFAMWLSLRLNNNVGVTGVMVSILFVSFLVRVPDRFRVLSQICGLIPTNLIAAGRFFDSRLVPIFGRYLTNFQFGAVIYIFFAVLFVWGGRRKYI